MTGLLLLTPVTLDLSEYSSSHIGKWPGVLMNHERLPKRAQRVHAYGTVVALRQVYGLTAS